jgi:Protein of unknown function (DUF3306)
MSEPEKSVQEFLQRWSRRKLGNVDGERRPPDEQAAGGEGTEPAPPADAPRGALGAAAPAFDPASLPPIESITAASDVRAFLAPGVPLELTRAALRRAWVSDPNIRDFIGIAENQWDFTKPDGVPGFGPLEFTAELHRMVAELHIATPSDDGTAAAANSRKTALPDPAATSSPDSAATSPVVAPPPAVTQSVDKNAAVQNDFASDAPVEPTVPRRHGGALPK